MKIFAEIIPNFKENKKSTGIVDFKAFLNQIYFA